jgi:RHS repeat-associated protein
VRDSTSGIVNTSGVIASTISYFPFGLTRTSTGTLPTDMLFTGQRKVATDPLDGLYYYNARYYDAKIGRFISADTIVPDPVNPQALNRYSYCLNNPLKFTDPTGHYNWWGEMCGVVNGTGSMTDEQSGRGTEGNSAGRRIGDVSNLSSKSYQWVFPSSDQVIGAGALAAFGNIARSTDGHPVLKADDIVYFAANGILYGITFVSIEQNRDAVKGWLNSLTTFFSSKEGKVINDFKKNPGNWEKTGEKSEPATNKDFKGGTSVDEKYRNKQTGQEIERHKIIGPNGEVLHDHFRVP